MDKLPRIAVALLGLIYALASVLAAMQLPNNREVTHLVAREQMVRAGACDVIAAACLAVITGCFAALMDDYREAPNRARVGSPRRRR